MASHPRVAQAGGGRAALLSPAIRRSLPFSGGPQPCPYWTSRRIVLRNALDYLQNLHSKSRKKGYRDRRGEFAEYLESTEEVHQPHGLEEVPVINPDTEHPFPKAANHQQSLRRSFTIGGIGLQTGEYAYVRVRPAFANEGRYFVIVPRGTNEGRYALEQPEEVDPDELNVEAPAQDPLDEERTELFFQWLDAREEDDYEGNLDEFLETHGKDFNALFAPEEDVDDLSKPDEVVQERSEDEAWIPASLSAASAASTHHIALERNGHRVLSPEALLSALDACGIENARIEIEGGAEVPVVDGSAVGWVVDIRAAGVKQAAVRRAPGVPAAASWSSPEAPLSVHDDTGFIAFFPGDTPRVSCGVSFKAPVIGLQWHTWRPDRDMHYRYEIAPARRHFNSLAEAKALVDEGLMLGGPDRVALVAAGETWFDAEMSRFPTQRTEAARHAVQILLGVLSLAADPGTHVRPTGHIVAFNASLDLQLRFARLYSEAAVRQDLQWDESL